MTNDKDFSNQLAPRKSNSLPVKKTSNQEQKYIKTLESEKASLLEQVANYVKEQKLAVTAFKHQEKLLGEKDKQLDDKDQLITENEQAITKLKTRIHELAQELNFLKKFNSVSEAIETANIGTQTAGTNPTELEEALLEKRVENLKDFGTYREKLAQKETEISKLQKKLKKLGYQPNHNEKKVFLLTVLLVIVTTLLLFK